MLKPFNLITAAPGWGELIKEAKRLEALYHDIIKAYRVNAPFDTIDSYLKLYETKIWDNEMSVEAAISNLKMSLKANEENYENYAIFGENIIDLVTVLLQSNMDAGNVFSWLKGQLPHSELQNVKKYSNKLLQSKLQTATLREQKRIKDSEREGFTLQKILELIKKGGKAEARGEGEEGKRGVRVIGEIGERGRIKKSGDKEGKKRGNGGVKGSGAQGESREGVEGYGEIQNDTNDSNESIQGFPPIENFDNLSREEKTAVAVLRLLIDTIDGLVQHYNQDIATINIVECIESERYIIPSNLLIHGYKSKQLDELSMSKGYKGKLGILPENDTSRNIPYINITELIIEMFTRKMMLLISDKIVSDTSTQIQSDWKNFENTSTILQKLQEENMKSTYDYFSLLSPHIIVYSLGLDFSSKEEWPYRNNLLDVVIDGLERLKPGTPTAYSKARMVGKETVHGLSVDDSILLDMLLKLCINSKQSRMEEQKAC